MEPIAKMRMPKYRTRSDKDWAFVEIGGHRTRLPGRANSKESKDAYRELVRKVYSASPAKTAVHVGHENRTVEWLVGEYLLFAAGYFDARSLGNIRDAVRPLVAIHGLTPIDEFGPIALDEVRNAAITGSWIEKGSKCSAWSRATANAHVNRMRGVFRWAVSRQMIPPSILQSLLSLEPLKKGRTSAKEKTPTTPVDPAHVAAVIPFMSPVVAAMVQVQQLTGMRSDNLCALRPCDIDTSGEVWVYRPPKHKSQWRGRVLDVPIGPRAQAILRPFLSRPITAYCFSPIESEILRLAELRKKRKTPVQPSQANRSRKSRNLCEKYRTSSYRKAIVYAIGAANKAIKAANKDGRTVPHWHPHQLRHSLATVARAQFGLEASQVILGHANANVTQIYAERDLSLAKRVAVAIG